MPTFHLLDGTGNGLGAWHQKIENHTEEQHLTFTYIHFQHHYIMTQKATTEPHIDVYYSVLRVHVYFKHDGFRLNLICYSEIWRKLVTAYHPRY